MAGRLADLQRLVLGLALCCMTGLAGCGGGPAGPASAPTGVPTSDRAAKSCPILSSAEVDAVVGTHMTDHFGLTPQGQSPLGSSAVACDFDSGEGRTLKLLVAKSGGSFDEMLAKAGSSASKCPAVDGIGERAVSCSGEGEAAVFAEAGGRFVVVYRGGEPGGRALLTEATEIAKLIAKSHPQEGS